MTPRQDASCFTQKTRRNGHHGSQWPQRGPIGCDHTPGEHDPGAMQAALGPCLGLRDSSPWSCTDSETVGPPLFRLQLCFPTSSKMIGAWTNLQWITSGKQEHFPPNSFVLEDKRTEGLYKAQKQMSFTEFTIFIHSLQVPLVATDEGVILLRVLFCFSNLQVFCS